MAIAIGDPAGIGPEIALKALLQPLVHQLCNPLLVGDARVVGFYAARLGLPLQVRAVAAPEEAAFVPGIADVLHVPGPDPQHLQVGRSDSATARAMLAYTRAALDLALGGRVDAVVACPHDKGQAEAALGRPFGGYTALVAEHTGTPPGSAFLMLVGGGLRVVMATLHVPLKEAAAQVRRPLVLQAILAAHRAARQLGVPEPRIGVCGLNPHAGEGGIMGWEDAGEVAPAVTDARALGVDAEGPCPADTLFPAARQGRFHVCVAMYHDQGHIPVKLLAPHGAAALTVGTPVLFASVAHGTAADIAGQGVASPDALLAALRVVCGLGD